MAQDLSESEIDDLARQMDKDYAETAPDREATYYEAAITKVVQALEMTQEQLRSLRDQRAAINAQIRALVADEAMLRRMSRVAHKPADD